LLVNRTIIPGYGIKESAREGRRWRWYRGQRHMDQRPVLIKTPRKQPTDQLLGARLEKEYKTLQDIQIPGVIKVYDYIKSTDGIALILEDTGGSFLDQLISTRRLSLTEFLQIAIRLSTCIAGLHSQKILHANIHPGAILSGPEAQNVWITGFDRAVRLDTGAQDSTSYSLSKGHLAYIAPEQTSRMDAIVDYRSDLYSMGVLFYQLLTGRLPFRTEEPLELVHCHLARTPTPPSDIDSEIPGPLSDLVMQLLKKKPDDRYQNALNLLEDLNACHEQYRSTGVVRHLTTHRQGRPEHFEIPQRLYGRSNETRQLLDAFERVRKGGTELVFVAGYSGVGKTSLIQHIREPVVKHNGYFASGKYDQLERSTPYSAIIVAFRGLVRQILTESDEQITDWRQRLLEVLGPNGKVITEVIPELALIIGEQPQLPELKPIEAQNRFNLYFQRFVNVFAHPSHPLVLFLDDLQWASVASTQLLQAWVTGFGIDGLLMIGAYRDNEVDSHHPLRTAIKSIREAGGSLLEITLLPLALSSVTQLIRDALGRSEGTSRPLGECVQAKTDGNPFFTKVFLENLHEEGLLYFDPAAGWSWKMEDIEAIQATDNVVDLMARKIERLPPQTRETTKLAAIIGNRFDLGTLATASSENIEITIGKLEPAVAEGLILRFGNDYLFYHDRIQEAAHGLIPVTVRPQLHYQIGSLLLARYAENELEDHIFEIANHINAGSELIMDTDERTRLALLNLQAGSKAKTSTAYETALDYFEHGADLLPVNPWVQEYDLSFALHRERAECAYLCGHFDEAESGFDLLMKHAKTRLEKAAIYNMRIVQYENLSRFAEASAFGCEGLALFDIKFPETKAERISTVDDEINSIQKHLEGKNIEELIHLPVMADADVKVCMKLLMTMWSSSYISDDIPLTMLIAATMVRLSLQHGNTEESAYGYVTYAINIASRTGDYQSAYEFGLLALNINREFDDRTARAKVNHMFSCYICFWRKHINECFAYSRVAYESGLESGDFTYGGYGAFHESWHALFGGMNLDHFNEEYSAKLQFLTGYKYQSISDAHQLILQWGLSLQGRTDEELSLDGRSFSEQAYLDAYQDVPFFAAFYYVAKLNICYLFMDYSQAIQLAEKAESTIHGVRGMIWDSILCFNHALTLAAVYDSLKKEQKPVAWQKLEILRQQMQRWAENGPENYAHQHALICAEMARLQNQPDAAITNYEKAIQSARENGFIQNEALANELFGRYWLQRDHDRLAAMYLQDAEQRYQQWGSPVKSRQITTQYAEVLQQAGGSGTDLSETLSTSESLNLSTVLKATQAISGEMIKSRLVERLMQILLENAGAQRGLLLCPEGSTWKVDAEGVVVSDSISVRQSDESDLETAWSSAVVNYVSHTRENLIVSNAQNDSRLLNDAYVQESCAESILCVPIVHQQELAGILYLENNLISNAFTPDLVLLVQTLATQAAIALENARLYSDVMVEIGERRQAEQALNTSEEKYRLLVENQTDLVVKLDPTGRFLFASPSLCEMFEMTEHELLESSFHDLIHPHDCEIVIQEWKHLSTEPYTTQIEHRIRTNADERWLAWSLKAVNGTGSEIIGSGRDVTNRRRAEEQARQNLQDLAHMSRLQSMGEMASTLAHELNQPLTAILSFAQASQRVLNQDDIERKELANALERISSNAERAGGIISRTRDFVRKKETQLLPADVNELVGDAIKLVDADLRQAGVELVLDLQNPLALVRVDPVQIQQVILNLLRNSAEAIQDSDARERKITVSSCEGHGSIIEVTVADTGPGIDPSIEDKVFSAFVTTKSEGMGIGLSICRSIIRSHGGELSTRPRPEGGTIFRFVLPLDKTITTS